MTQAPISKSWAGRGLCDSDALNEKQNESEICVNVGRNYDSETNCWMIHESCTQYVEMQRDA